VNHTAERPAGDSTGAADLKTHASLSNRGSIASIAGEDGVIVLGFRGV
jgi:hypothetical protein